MTPQQVEEAARARYNAVSSTFYSQDEVFKVIYAAEQELATEGWVIEGKDTSIPTVSGTRIYSFPSLFIAIKRIEYDGRKLEKIDDREDDSLTIHDSGSQVQGTPAYYWVWNDQVYLRPVPDAAETLTIYGYKEATLLTTASSTLSVPVRFHSKLINPVIAALAEKDENFEAAQYYRNLWDVDVEKVRRLKAKLKRTDGFAVVKDEESLGRSPLGLR